MLYDKGGSGRSILLLHGLMGSAATWRRQIPWLREFGRVHTYDAPGHRRPPPPELTTEAFVDDLIEHLETVGPSVLVGHSMGALHGWCAAARRPDLVTALVVEDIAPDFRGRTADGWAAMIRAWPRPFPDADAVRAFFGDVAGQYFLDSFELSDDGWRLHGDVDTFEAISQEWGTRHFWNEWDAVRAPVLLIEGEHTITPAGQMSRMHSAKPGSVYVRVEGAAHLVHDEAPERYRDAVEGFLRTLGSSECRSHSSTEST
ncbi:alpha/beta hydrolase [Rhodococcus fascians]|nr:alpha/beta hydrolase [Rhodococcus fascians]MBY4021417.1 alpha/beta hydrolase [Rhodococcus fascians]